MRAIHNSLPIGLTVGLVLIAADARGQHQPLVPNSQHYAERNPSAVRGRSGSAVISLRALGSVRTGDVTLEAATGGLDGSWPYPVGTFAGLQLKAYTANGAVESTTNLPLGANAGSVVFDAVPLVIGQSYQVEARVRGVDGSRTDVVTAQASVRRRPDLTIALVDPGRAPIATTTNITAIVSNRGTDVGASASCRLFVGDSPDSVDQANGIWIDGGDSVSCVFSHVFNQLGLQPVRVAVGDAVPADDDPSNDEARGVIDVFDNPTPDVVWTISKSRTAIDQGHLHAEGFSTLETPPTVHGSEWNYDYVYGLEAYESTELILTSPTAIFYPLVSLDLSSSSAGQSLAHMHETNVPPDFEYGDTDNGGSYLSRYDAATQTVVYVESRHDVHSAGTVLDAQRIASVVTYWASGYTHTWLRTPNDYLEFYDYYTPRDDVAGVLSPALDETVLLTAVDAAGRTFAGGGTVSPSTQELWIDRPYQCFDSARRVPRGLLTQHVCGEQLLHESNSSGFASGPLP